MACSPRWHPARRIPRRYPQRERHRAAQRYPLDTQPPRHAPRGPWSGIHPLPSNSEYRPDWFCDERLGGVCNHASRPHITEDLYRYLFVASYARLYGRSPELRDFPASLLPKHKNAHDEKKLLYFDDRFRVQLTDQPATTITSHIAKDGHYYIHYDESQCRSLTVREAARLQTFPDNYFFCGTRTQQYVHRERRPAPVGTTYRRDRRPSPRGTTSRGKRRKAGMRNAGRGSVLNPLFKLAVLAGAEVVIRFHIGRGDDINAQDDDGRSPLLLAALRGNATACRLLLEAGANPLLADNEGKDALAVANTKGFVEVAGAISDHLTRKDPATIPETALPAIDPQDRSDQLTTVHHDTKTAAPPASDRQDINDIPTTADRDTFSETTPPPVNGQRDVTNYQTTADHTTRSPNHLAAGE